MEWNDLVVGVATAAGCSKVCTNMFLPGSRSHFLGFIFGLYLQVGGLEHEFYDFPYIGNRNPN